MALAIIGDTKAWMVLIGKTKAEFEALKALR